MKRFRESRLGRFVTAANAREHPDTTVAETDTNAKLRRRVAALELVMREQAGHLRLQTGIQNLEWIANELERAAGDEQA